MEGKRVLIIDKSTDFCLITQGHFRKQHCEASYCHTWEEGLQEIETLRPDVILLEDNDEWEIEKNVLNKIDLMQGYNPSIRIVPVSHHQPQPPEGDLLG